MEMSTGRTALSKNSSQRNKTALFQSSHISVSKLLTSTTVYNAKKEFPA